MSKLVAMLVACAGASVVSVGGVYMLKKDNGTGQGDKDQPKQEDKLNEDLGFKDLDNFKSNKGGSCVKKLFKDVDFNSIGDAINGSDKKIEDSHFSADGDSESCLIVNWERKPTTLTSGQKWLGNFRWLWAFKKGTKGFVMFVTTKTSGTAKTFSLEGGVYFVEQDSNTQNWTIKKNKVLSSQTINDTDFDSKFPKAGTTFKTDITPTGDSTDKSYWGFISTTSDLGDVCTTGEANCPTDPAPEAPFKGLWVWTFSSDAGQDVITKWSETFDTWSVSLFNDAKLKDILKSFKGKWTKQPASTPTS